MKTLNITQGSKDWHDYRATAFNASEASSMLGLSKYQTRNDLLKSKKFGIEQEVNDQLQALFDRGHEAESKARPIAEAVIGDDLSPIVGYIEIDGMRIGASFDGIDLMGEIAWEHKLYNEKLFASLQNSEIPEQYKPQLEQQLLVSGAKSVLFMCSDGTSSNCQHIYYYSDENLRKQIIDGWKQFAKDLETFEFKEAPKEIEKVTVSMDMPLPAVKVTGAVIASNLDDVDAWFKHRIASVKTELVSDADFGEADSTVKAFKKAEDELDVAKKQILNQTADISQVLSKIDGWRDAMRDKRLLLEKLVKNEKDRRKADLVTDARKAYESALSMNDATLSYLNHNNALLNASDFANAIKGKKTLKSMSDALDDLVAKGKSTLVVAMDECQARYDALKISAIGYESLFHDAQSIANNNNADAITAIAQQRIAQFEADQQAKIEAEKAKFEAEAKQQAEIESLQENKKEVNENEQTQEIEVTQPTPIATAPTVAVTEPTYSEIAPVQTTTDQRAKVFAMIFSELSNRQIITGGDKIAFANLMADKLCAEFNEMRS